MKKMISLAFAALMFIGASAMPQLGVKRVAMQDVPVTVDGAVAWRAEGTVNLYGESGKDYYQFQIVFENGETKIAALTIYTLANDKLAGCYAIAPTNGSYVFAGESKVPVYGYMSLACKVAQGGTLGTYEVVAELYDGQGNSVAMTGTMPNFIAVDYATYQTNPQAAGIVLTDAVGDLEYPIEVYTGDAEGLDLETYAPEYWGYFAGDAQDPDVVCWMPFDKQGDQYGIIGGGYFVESGSVVGSLVMRGVMEVEWISNEEANFSAILQCEDGSVYYLQDFNNPSGVEEVKAAETEGTAKIMKDGQLIIIRNGVRYNAQGALVD